MEGLTLSLIYFVISRKGRISVLTPHFAFFNVITLFTTFSLPVAILSSMFHWLFLEVKFMAYIINKLKVIIIIKIKLVSYLTCLDSNIRHLYPKYQLKYSFKSSMRWMKMERWKFLSSIFWWKTCTERSWYALPKRSKSYKEIQKSIS